MQVRLSTYGANQNEVTIGDVSLFFSYETLVAMHIQGHGYLRSGKSWSKTTTRHVNKWIGDADCQVVTQEALEARAAISTRPEGK
jgi:hypothetical protein